MIMDFKMYSLVVYIGNNHNRWKDVKVVLSFLAVFLAATNQHRPEAYPQDYVAGIAAVQAPETNKIMPTKIIRQIIQLFLVMKRVGKSNHLLFGMCYYL